MRTRVIVVAAAIGALARVGEAQSVGKMLTDDFTNAAKDVVGVWGSPFHASSRDWLLTAAAFGAFGASMLADQSVSDWAIDNDTSAFFRALKPVRRGGKLFSGKYVVPPVAAAYVVGVAIKNQDVRDFVMGCMSSWGAQSAVRKTVYLLVGRARPDTFPDEPQKWEFPGGSNWMMHSFPAGHFANAMACATYWNKRFHLGAVGPAVYALAAGVGVGRLADKAHWTSDTVLGGILGYAVGKEIARRALAREVDRRGGGSGATGASLNLAPGAGGGMTLNLNWTF
jgi:membrane-associated phospholipid phosphatase